MLIEIILGSLLLISLVAIFVMGMIIRGSVLTDDTESSEIRHLTGREIELIRRKLATVGMSSIHKSEILGIIKTIRDTHLGTYTDADPYVPADPYVDIDED